MMKLMNIFKCLEIMAVLCMAVSCIGVEYGYVDEGNGAPEGFGTSALSVGFVWPQPEQDGEQGEDVQTPVLPSGMTVTMARKVNEVHYIWNLAGDDLMPDSAAPWEKDVRNGDYLAAAFDAPAASYKTNLDKFRAGVSLPLTSLSASVKAIDGGTLKKEYGISSGELCPEYPALESVQPLWQASSEISCGADRQPAVLSFSPADLTVEIEVSIKVRTVAGASVSGITAVLAGVPSSVNLMSGEVNENPVGKAVFRLSPEQAGAEGQTVVYSGKVRTLGAFSSGQGSWLAGSGILWLAVDAAAGSVERRLHKGINVRNLIVGQGFMEKADEGSGYRVVKNAARMAVGTLITIDGNKLIAGDGAVEPWSGRALDAEEECR